MGDGLRCEEVFEDILRFNNASLVSLTKYNTSALWEVDVTKPDAIFDYHTFKNWFTNDILPKYANKTADQLLQLEKEIVVYMNRSMCFVSASKPAYYVLKHNDVFQQNVWTPMDEPSFKKIFSARYVTLPKRGKDKEGNTKFTTFEKSLFDIYSKSDLRRQHEDVVFHPPEGGRVTKSNQLNLWMGYRYSADRMEEGAKSRTARETCLKFLRFIYEIHCSSSRTLFIYMMNWMATKFRHPGRKMSTVPCFYSKKQRVGKGFVINTYGHLFGQHYTTTTSSHDLTGRFTGLVDQLVLLFLDEVGDLTMTGSTPHLRYDESEVGSLRTHAVMYSPCAIIGNRC